MIELGLQRISNLLAQTSLPWRAVHVAGTNGKGSVCAYISEMLNTYNRSQWREKNGQSRITHGLYTSPHIVDRWDCISLSKHDRMEVVSRDLFLETENQVSERNREHNIGASEFEILTATAFEVFTRSRLDIAVIETGMGGRLDATNVIGQPLPQGQQSREGGSELPARPLPLVTAITKVGLDHQGFLGDTVEAIAREKAGIFKHGTPALWDESNQPSVLRVLYEESRTRGSRPLDWMDTERWLKSAALSRDKHVMQNTVVAFQSTWTAFSALGRVPRWSDKHEKEHLANLIDEMSTAAVRVQFPGRLETVDISCIIGQKADPVLLDGAHNAQSAEVLAARVHQLRKLNEHMIWIVAASDTKDVKEILQPVLTSGDSVLAVEFGPVDGMPWVKPTKGQSILDVAQNVVPNLKGLLNFEDDVAGALKAANDLRTEQSVAGRPANLVIAGSLYLVGAVHRLLRTAIVSENA